MSGDGHVHALPPGYRLHEYRIERVLGHGGFGITYQAVDENLAARVAIKEYLPDEFAVRDARSTVQPKTAGGQEEFRWGLTRFLEEAQTLARFRHPNIVQVLRLFRANGTAYIVMPYERGRSLADYLQALGRTLTEPELLSMAAPLLDGLDAVHREGFLHRDVKPGNVFIRSTAVPILLDFGSARLQTGTKSRNMTAILTPGYAPIEQYGAADQGPWTDIYGFAGVLYRCLSGQSPPGAPERSRALLAGEPDPLRPAAEVGRDGFAPETLAAIDHGLRVTARERPQSVAEWRGALLAARRKSGRGPVAAPEEALPAGAAQPPPSGRPAERSARHTERSGGLKKAVGRPLTGRADTGRSGAASSSGSGASAASAQSAGPAPDADRSRRPAGRRVAPYVAAGLALALLLGGGAVWMALAPDPDPTPERDSLAETRPAEPSQERPPAAADDPPEAAEEGDGAEEPDARPAGPDESAAPPPQTGQAAVPQPFGPRVADAVIHLTTSAIAGVGPVPLTVPLQPDWAGRDRTFRVASLPANGALRWRGRRVEAGDGLPGSALGDLTFEAPADAAGSDGRLALERDGQIRATLAVRAIAHRCDRLAAGPGDPAAPPPGVAFPAIDAERAVAACRAAVERYPEVDRFPYQLSRALAAADRRAEAMETLRRAADRGHRAAIDQLARLEAEATAEPPSAPRADRDTPLGRVRELAGDGDPAAQRELARRLYYGEGVGRDRTAAAEWLRRAAEGGDPWAQTLLGIMHLHGEVVRRDLREARRLFDAAAARDFPGALLSLGFVHREGLGVPRRPARAAGYFAAAAAEDSDAAAGILPKALDGLRGLPATALTEAAQRLLARLGYRPGRQDGRPDAATRAAVRRFQESAGFAVDGRVDAELLAALAAEGRDR
jgi:serine/threonine protein kinase/TPR repeat protein